jgi:hypothetical protein
VGLAELYCASRGLIDLLDYNVKKQPPSSTALVTWGTADDEDVFALEDD